MNLDAGKEQRYNLEDEDGDGMIIESVCVWGSVESVKRGGSILRGH